MRRAKLDATEKEQTMATRRTLNKGTDMLQLDIARHVVVDASEAFGGSNEAVMSQRSGFYLRRSALCMVCTSAVKLFQGFGHKRNLALTIAITIATNY